MGLSSRGMEDVMDKVRNKHFQVTNLSSSYLTFFSNFIFCFEKLTWLLHMYVGALQYKSLHAH